MGLRNAGLVRAGFRRGNAPPSTAITPVSERSLLRSTEWYIAGYSILQPSTGTFTQANGGNILSAYMALPEFFPEAGQITALAMGVQRQFTTYGSDHAWIGIAPNRRVGNDYFPDTPTVTTNLPVQDNLAVYFTGATGLTYNVDAGSIHWFCFQQHANGVNPSSLFECLNNSPNFKGVLGAVHESGVTPGSTVVWTGGTNATWTNGQYYYTTGQAYSQGVLFDQSTALVKDTTATAPWSSGVTPAIHYKFVRT